MNQHWTCFQEKNEKKKSKNYVKLKVFFQNKDTDLELVDEDESVRLALLERVTDLPIAFESKCQIYSWNAIVSI